MLHTVCRYINQSIAKLICIRLQNSISFRVTNEERPRFHLQYLVLCQVTRHGKNAVQSSPLQGTLEAIVEDSVPLNI